MPYKDKDDRRRYDRDRRRLERAGQRTNVIEITPATRLRVVEDVEAVLSRAVGLVMGDKGARGTDKARALTQIAGVALRLVEANELADRLEALEQVLQLRKVP